MPAWGIEHIVNAEGAIEGTSAVEIRRILGALYSPGLVMGANVITSSTDMSYTVEPGVVAIKLADDPREIVLASFDLSNILVNPTGASARTDTIYIRQFIPGSSGTNIATVEVAEGGTVPANAQVISTYHMPANSTTTSQGWFTGSKSFSVPYAANLGVFYQHTDTSNAVLPRTVRTGASGVIDLPTDRTVLLTMNTCLSAVRSDGTTRAVKFDNVAYCEAKFDVLIDGTKRFTWNTPGLHQAWADYHFQEYINLKQGEHTISYRTYTPASSVSPGLPARHYSGAEASTGTTFTVRDGGFWEDTGV